MHIVYYSPASSTRNIARLIGKFIGEPIEEYDLIQNPGISLEFDSSELLLFAVPVFAGRVPVQASEALSGIRGNNTPAILVCMYGNRDYDDALLELKDITCAQGFTPIAGGAFIARHSIFPNMGKGRPDDEDKIIISGFAGKCAEIYNKYIADEYRKELKVKGNFPYRDPSVIPLYPEGDARCNNCGTCVKLCPASAIPDNDPCKTDCEFCISCARCVSVCPQQSRAFRGNLYESVKMKFDESLAKIRKEPDMFF